MKQKIALFSFSFCLILFSCQSRSNVNYSKGFGNCLNKSDKEIINQLTEHFELLLTKNFPNMETSVAYQKYLEAISKMEVQPDFLLNDESLILVKSIKETKTFNKIWTKLEIEDNQFENSESEQIVTINKDKKEKEEFRPLFINPNGEFLNCLINKAENKDFKEILETKKEISNISNGLVALALLDSLQKGDYENGLVRVFIALNLYYEYTLNLGKLKISG